MAPILTMFALKDITVDSLMQWASMFVFVMSLITLVAPPVEWFDKWPKFQERYKFALLVIAHYAALNFRAALWSKYIDTQAPGTPPQS